MNKLLVLDALKRDVAKLFFGKYWVVANIAFPLLFLMALSTIYEYKIIAIVLLISNIFLGVWFLEIVGFFRIKYLLKKHGKNKVERFLSYRLSALTGNKSKTIFTWELYETNNNAN